MRFKNDNYALNPFHVDNVCIESLSIDINRNILDSSARSIKLLSQKIEKIKETDASRLKNEYQRLVEGLRESRASRETDEIMANPVLPDEVLQEAIPGNIRRVEHFVAFLRRFIEYLKVFIFIFQSKNRHGDDTI